MKCFETKLSDLQLDLDIRCDAKFYDFAIVKKFHLSNKKKKQIQLKDILVPEYVNFNYKEGEEYQGVPTGKEYYDEDGEVVETIVVTKNKHPGRIKYSVKTNQILISSVKSAKVPPVLVKKEYTSYVFSNGFYIFRVKKGWDVKFIYYLLRSNKLRSILDNHLSRGIGISTYNQRDLLRIKIPEIDIKVQEKIVEKIEKIEKEVKSKKLKLEDEQEVINIEILKGFDFDEKKYQEKNKKIIFYRRTSEFLGSSDLRIGVNYLNPKYDVIDEFFEKYPHQKLKFFLEVRSKLGASPEYDDLAEAVYLTMATIKTNHIDLDEARKVSVEFYESKKESSSLKKDEIILARSGEGTIGKLALCEDNFKNIYCDFTMRIRPGSNINKKWLYYYMRTKIFQLQIMKWRKGMGNLTNIFPSQIDKLLVLEVSKNHQAKVVKIIDSKIEKINKIKEFLQKKRENMINLVIGTLV